MIYRIFTEDKGNLAEITSKYFSGFTLSRANGYWQGKSEPSVIIDLITSDKFESMVEPLWPLDNLLIDILRANNQESVLVTVNGTTAFLVRYVGSPTTTLDWTMIG